MPSSPQETLWWLGLRLPRHRWGRGHVSCPLGPMAGCPRGPRVTRFRRSTFMKWHPPDAAPSAGAVVCSWRQQRWQGANRLGTDTGLGPCLPVLLRAAQLPQACAGPGIACTRSDRSVLRGGGQEGARELGCACLPPSAAPGEESGLGGEKSPACPSGFALCCKVVGFQQ